jgi:S1-C subfamily serine protease
MVSKDSSSSSTLAHREHSDRTLSWAHSHRIVAAGILVLFALGALACKRAAADTTRKSIVRVTTRSGSGAGFFVSAPDGKILVATAFHIVSNGEPASIEREIKISESESYVEAFPQTRIAAFDENSDLALLEIKNFPHERIAALAMSFSPAQDGEITSWGFPASSIVGHLGLTSKHGRISNFVRLPVIDSLYGRTAREDAVDGLIVSTDLGPGFSGGPTLDQNGSVVGINVLKDKAYRGQNAAVRVSALAELMKVAATPAKPSGAAVEEFLVRVTGDYLRLPLEQRHEVFPTEIVALGELPQLKEIARFLRTYLWQRNSAATLGLAFAKMPGDVLMTYLGKPTRDRVSDCEKTQGGNLGELAGGERPTDCRELEVRPLLWDLVGATLHWSNDVGKYTVAKIEEVSGERRIFRVQVGLSGRPLGFPIYVTNESNQVRLRVTDERGRLYALTSPQGNTQEDFVGAWAVRERKTTTPTQVVQASSEKLEIAAAANGKLRASHLVEKVSTAATGNAFACNLKERVRDTISQVFDGALDNGVVVSAPSRPMRRVGDPECPKNCGTLCSSYTEDTSVVFKRVGASLVMYRTRGDVYPEVQHFVRDEPQPAK